MTTKTEKKREYGYQQAIKEVMKEITAVYCVFNKKYDDGVHITFKCPDCGQEWGEEQPTPRCHNSSIKRSEILDLLAYKLKI